MIKDHVLKEVVDLAYQLHLLVLQAAGLQVVGLTVLQVVGLTVLQVEQVVVLTVHLLVHTVHLLVHTVLMVDRFPQEHTVLMLRLLLPFPWEFLVQLRQQRLK